MLFDITAVERSIDAFLASLHPSISIVERRLYDSCAPRTGSAESRVALDDLEQTVAAVARTEEKVMRLHRALKTRVSIVQRTLSREVTLPTELLREIFILVADADETSKARIRLSHVSAQWRLVALGLPELWTIVQTRPSPYSPSGMLDEFIRRSCSLPLHLTSHHPPPTYDVPKDHKHTGRISSIALLGDVSYSALRSLIPSSQAIDLQELTLECYDRFSTFNICKEVGSARVLTLSNVTLKQRYPELVNSWTSMTMLTELHVLDCEVGDLVDSLQAIESSPLKRLTVSEFRWDDHADSYIEDLVQAMSNFDLESLDISDMTCFALEKMFELWVHPVPSTLVIELGPCNGIDDLELCEAFGLRIVSHTETQCILRRAELLI